MNIPVTIEDELLAARLIAAKATGDLAQLDLVLHDIATSPRPGGVLPVILALAADYVEVVRQVDPDGYIAGIQVGVVALTQRIEGPTPTS